MMEVLRGGGVEGIGRGGEQDGSLEGVDPGYDHSADYVDSVNKSIFECFCVFCIKMIYNQFCEMDKIV